jgi:hypothetical protein
LANKPKTSRECLCCRQTKLVSEFRSSRARRCLACDQVAAENVADGCAVCGGTLPPARYNATPGRVVCNQPECLLELKRYGGKMRGVQHRRLALATPPPTTRWCSHCETEKPLDSKHFYEKKAWPATRPSQRFSRWCRSCENARRRERRQERHDELLQRERKRRAELHRDKKRHAEVLELRRMAYRLKRERTEGVSVTDMRVIPPRGPVLEDTITPLPAKPLADAFERCVVRARMSVYAETDVEARNRLCRLVGISPRNLFGWRTGERDRVHFDVAGRVLQGLDMLWWEVWPPREFPEVAEVFEPKALAA